MSVALGTSILVAGGSTTATATVTDLHGAPLADAVVTWAVTPSGAPPGSVSPMTSVTNGSGIATTTLTAGPSAASGAVTATVGNAPAQLTGSARFTVGTLSQVLEESLAGGFLHTCALTTAGAPHCWGSGAFGQLGNSWLPHAGCGRPSRRRDGLHQAGRRRKPHLRGHEHGAAYCWGLNDFGQVGDNSQITRLTPQPVSGGLTFRTP